MKTLQTACALATALLLADAAGAQDARFELGVQVASALWRRRRSLWRRAKVA